jgi:hypothetical protein
MAALSNDKDNLKKRPHNGEEIEEAEMPKQKLIASLPFQSAKSGSRTLKSANTASRSIGGHVAHAKIVSSYKSSIEAPATSKKTSNTQSYLPDVVAPQKLQVSKNLSFERITTFAIADYTIKRMMTVLMSQSTAWLNETTAYKWGPSTTNQILSPAESIQNSAFYYQYPDNSFAREDEYAGLNIEEDRTIPKNGEYDPLISKLRSRWSDALLNAFSTTSTTLSYRSFYLFSKQSTLYVHHRKSESVVACINSTSYTLRKSLIKAGVKFKLPMVQPPNGTDPLTDEAVPDDNPKIDFSLDSLIIVEGVEHTTLLINFIIDSFQRGENWFGVCPSIISATPFLHASVCRLDITARETRLVDSDGKMVPHHYATIEGPILPESFQTIAEVFRSVLDPQSQASIACRTIQSTEWCGMAHAESSLEPSADANPHLEATISDLRITPDSFTYSCIINQKRGL